MAANSGDISNSPDKKKIDAEDMHRQDVHKKEQRELRVESVVKFRSRPSMMSSEHPENNYRGFVNCLIILLVISVFILSHYHSTSST